MTFTSNEGATGDNFGSADLLYTANPGGGSVLTTNSNYDSKNTGVGTPYTSGAITTPKTAIFGSSGGTNKQYFTWKAPGIFGLVADLNNVDFFNVYSEFLTISPYYIPDYFTTIMQSTSPYAGFWASVLTLNNYNTTGNMDPTFT